MELLNDESRFFSNYKWCYNPIRTFDELLYHLQEEIKRFPELQNAWQRNESKLNIYLFTCSISCTLADFISKRPWHLAPLYKRIPILRWPATLAESVLNFPSELNAFLSYRDLIKLQAEWDEIVEHTCRFLLKLNSPNGEINDDKIVHYIKDGILKYNSTKLPDKLHNARMKLNEGFRCQDLTPFDVKTLADRFLETNPDKQSPYLIIGSRTAGSYMAPVLKVYLEQHNFVNTHWITLRPKLGLSSHEEHQIHKFLSKNSHVILIDDYANTGYTFRMLDNIARSCGANPENIHLMAPIHPVVESRYDSQKEIKKVLSDLKQSNVHTIHHKDLYLSELIKPEKAENTLREFFRSDEIDNISITQNQEVTEINKRLWRDYPDSFQVRLKRVYDVRIRKTDGTIEKKRILAKSVGLGWFGYHAFWAGIKLKHFVPDIIGLRNGILFMEWIDGQYLSKNDVSEELIRQMAEYLASRSQSLKLNEDPRANRPYLGWGWLEILSIFKNAYHNLLGYLKYDELLKKLKTAIPSQPILTDGRMRPGEWIVSNNNGSSSKFYKIDFEHHNFGAPELDVVDPAYDIAITSFEFELSEDDETTLIDQYTRKSGDYHNITERIFIYKILYAKKIEDWCQHLIGEPNYKNREKELNRRLQWAWDFRVFKMNRFSSSLVASAQTHSNLNSDSVSGLFFMDIDGVFDYEVFGFPHTTISGLKAIRLLQRNGFSIIPNSGRNSFHIRNYCNSYGFKAGIGEYGSVLIDNMRNKEIPTISENGMAEIKKCRNILEKQDGIFVDNNYRYCVRAYHLTTNGTKGLSIDEAKNLLNGFDLGKIRIITRNADTYFVSKETDKGKAINYYKKYLGYSDKLTISVGDSDEDIFMFKESDLAFAPGNCSTGIRNFSKDGNCKIVSKPFQRGLFQIAKRCIQSKKDFDDFQYVPKKDSDSLQFMITQLLSIAESPRYKRLLSILLK